MSKVFSFGELLLRMSPALGGPWIREASMPVYVGGAELNAATALANWGVPVRYGSAAPDNALTQDILDHLESRGVDTGGVIRSGDRIGIYYLPVGSELKNAGVIYDRALSSFASLRTGTVDWDRLMDGCDRFHFSAITPALSQSAADLCREAVGAAVARGMTLSVDLNYRAKLWQYGRRPDEVMPALAEHCSLIMGNIWAAERLLGVPVDPEVHLQEDKGVFAAHARRSALEVMRRHPRCTHVANTFRFDRQDGLTYFATFDDVGRQAVAKTRHTKTVVDKVGSGDCFMAGLLYGAVNAMPIGDTVEFAAAAAFGKLQERGDATRQTVGDIIQNL